MSTLVTNEFSAQPGRGDDVANLLIEILGESLQLVLKVEKVRAPMAACRSS
jgi:hypothetical protein